MKLVPFSVPQIHLNFPLTFLGCLLRREVAGGPAVQRLEEAFARKIGVKYAICLSSARTALSLVYAFFNCKDKKVVVPAYTCIPAIDAVRWAGAKPLFVDIDLNTYNPIYEESLERVEDIGAISLSYLYGLIGDIEPFLKLAKRRNIPVIEDAAIAFGAKYKGKNAGAIGDAAVFSFQSSKIMTSWRGGIVTTDNRKLFEYLKTTQESWGYPGGGKLFLNLFITYLRRLCHNPFVYPWTMNLLKKIACAEGLNPIMQKLFNQNPTEALTGKSDRVMPDYEKTQFTNIQAMCIEEALKDSDAFCARRGAIAAKLDEALADNPVVTYPKAGKDTGHAFGRFPVRLKGKNKRDAAKLLRARGIETAPYYPYTVTNKGLKDGGFPNARQAAEETILLPMHTFLSDYHVYLLISAIEAITDKAEK